MSTTTITTMPPGFGLEEGDVLRLSASVGEEEVVVTASQGAWSTTFPVTNRRQLLRSTPYSVFRKRRTVRDLTRLYRLVKDYALR